MSANNSTIFFSDDFMKDDGFTISKEVRTLLLAIILLISLFGIISNVINVIVFYRLQNGGDPININLLGLAVSDFFVCLTTFFFFALTADWILEDIFRIFKINPVEVFYIIIGVPHTIFVRISILLTALISLERCLCVVFPLKVKMIVSITRVKVSVAVSFLIGAIVCIPIYYVNRLEWVYVPFLNTSILRHVKTDQFYEVNYWFTPLEGVCLHIIPFVLVTVCTVVMVKSLKKIIAFRQSIKRLNSAESVRRERKVVNMLVIMSVAFLTSNLPNIALFIIVSFNVSEFSLETSNEHTNQLIGLIPILLNTINASINSIIYFSNSSNYNKAIKKMFRLNID